MRRVPALLIAAALAAASLGASGSNDPLRDRQYGLDAIRAPEAWASSRGAGQVIAIVDTGIQLDHPDLSGKLLRDRSGRVVGFDAVDGGTPDDGNGHGTLVAGTAAAATGNGIGIASVAPDARLMPVRVLDDRGAGSLSNVDRGIRWAVDNGADVVNLSLESSLPLPGQVLSSGPDAAVRYAWERGVVVVAAAGNSGTPFTDYAASTPVLLVGATDARDRQTTFSDSGRRDMVLAPGVDIVSTTCDPCGARGRAAYGSASGTSFAAPHVAGAVAVLLAQGRSPADTVAALRETAVAVPRPAGSGPQGHGRIDLAAAVARPGAAAAPRATSPAPRSPSPPPTSSPSPDGGSRSPAPAPRPSPTSTAPPPSTATTPTVEPSPTDRGDEDRGDEDLAAEDRGDDVEATAPEDPEPDAPAAEDPDDEGAPPGSAPLGDVSLPEPAGGGAPVALVFLATGLVAAVGSASLHALGRYPSYRGS